MSDKKKDLLTKKLDVGVKAPDYDTYGIVTHYVLPQLTQHSHIVVLYAPLLCSYWGGSQGHSTTSVRAHVVSDLLTLVSKIKI